MNAKMTGAQAVVRTLKQEGIERIFAVPGLQLDHLFNALYDEGAAAPRVFGCRHEQGAGYMAFGAAQSTGRPSAFAVVPGPGFLNASAALATAYACNAPVLALSGQILSHQIGRAVGWLHELPDQLAIGRGLSKWASRINHPAEVPGIVRQAFAQMTSGRPRPVYLEVPMDVLAQVAEVDLASGVSQRPRPGEGLDLEMIRAAAQCLGKAVNPMILVGGGIFGAEVELLALAEMLQAPVVMTRNAFGVLDCRHPLALSEPAGHRVWAEVDTVLVVGTRFQPQTVGYARPNSFWGIDEALKVIRVDVDPVEINRLNKPHIAIVGDARSTLAALLDEVPRHNQKRTPRAQEFNRIKLALKAELYSKIAPQMAYLDAIRAELPEDGFFVEELTQIGYAARFAFPTYRARTYVSTGYQGTLGFGFATALGVKAANPDKVVVSICGDGGFMFTAAELATAAQHGIATVTVIFNDNAFGNVRRMQQVEHGGRVIASELRNPDFVAFGKSFGIDSERAHGPSELRAALKRAFARNAPTLIEVPLGEMPDPWQFVRLPTVRGPR